MDKEKMTGFCPSARMIGSTAGHWPWRNLWLFCSAIWIITATINGFDKNIPAAYNAGSAAYLCFVLWIFDRR